MRGTGPPTPQRQLLPRNHNGRRSLLGPSWRRKRSGGGRAAHAENGHTSVAVGTYLDSGKSMYLHGEDKPVWPRGRGMPRGHTGTVARHKPEVPRAAPVAS
ncbi:hypothetical protein TNCT6_61160 [Streptomyces sp. 6-11-2]|nr:hypothetical protein TNCT6_61160 [Streptomyces sp. 6-11-2]